MSVLDALPIVDVDSHVTEPRDLWTSRMSRQHAETVPRVVWDPIGGENRWKIGDVLLSPETEYSNAGWPEPFPAHPTTLEDADPACYDPSARLGALDSCGIFAQVLYPNLIGFDSLSFLEELGPELANEAVRAYNDFIHEFASVDRNRLIPIAMLPYWDHDATIAELQRVSGLGFTGVLMGALLSRLGHRNLSDPSWDRVLSAVEETGQSINLHVSFNSMSRKVAEKSYERRTKAALAQRTNRVSFMKMLANPPSITEAVADLILNGTFVRHPRLKVVSVESGFGQFPYLLDNLDWHWQTTGANDEHPDREMPSVYWFRHFYATFWFEHRTLRLLDEFQDNVMFETDFPHGTGVFPGPWGHNVTAREQARRNLAGAVSDEVAAKVLATNAAALYGIKLPGSSSPDEGADR